jgi:hypothetical protein
VPFDGTFKNHNDVIPVLNQKDEDRYDRSDLLRNWKNKAENIFLQSTDDVDELASFLKANETEGTKSVHFLFLNDLDAVPQKPNHIVIDVSGFSEKNVAAIHQFIKQLSQAKDFQDVLRIQTEFMRTQMQAFGEQATSLVEAFTKTASSEVKMPFKTSLE